MPTQPKDPRAAKSIGTRRTGQRWTTSGKVIGCLLVVLLPSLESCARIRHGSVVEVTGDQNSGEIERQAVERFEATSFELGGTAMPADFQYHEAIALVGGRLAKRFPKVLADTVGHIHKHIGIVLLISKPEERETINSVLDRYLGTDHIASEAIVMLEIPTNSIWIRDFGPLFTRSQSKSWTAVDAGYYSLLRRRDDNAPQGISEVLRAQRRRIAIPLQGGNIISNGAGILLTTSQAVKDGHRAGYDAVSVAKEMKRELNADSVVFLEPLFHEQTGHVDAFACFVSASTVIVGEYSMNVDPINSQILNRNAMRIGQLRDRNGNHLKVVRVPMPTNSDGAFRTHTNVAFANNAVLVPIYPASSPETNDQALQLFRNLLPDRDVVGVDADALIMSGGALRCVTLQIPSTSMGIDDSEVDREPDNLDFAHLKAILSWNLPKAHHLRH